MKFRFSPLVVSNISVDRDIVFFLYGFKYFSLVQQVYLKWARYKLFIGPVFVIERFCLEAFHYKTSRSENMPKDIRGQSKLSPNETGQYVFLLWFFLIYIEIYKDLQEKGLDLSFPPTR